MSKYKRKRTSRKPVVVAGVEWHSYQTGVGEYELRSTRGDGSVWRYSHRTVWRASVGGTIVGKRFQYESTALTAASKEINRRAKLAEPPTEVRTLVSLINEFIGLCELGDTNEATDAYGWGDLIRRAKLAIGMPVSEYAQTLPPMPPQVPRTLGNAPPPPQKPFTLCKVHQAQDCHDGCPYRSKPTGGATTSNT